MQNKVHLFEGVFSVSAGGAEESVEKEDDKRILLHE